MESDGLMSNDPTAGEMWGLLFRFLMMTIAGVMIVSVGIELPEAESVETCQRWGWPKDRLPDGRWPGMEWEQCDGY